MDTHGFPPAQPPAAAGRPSAPAAPGLPDVGPLTVLEALAAAACLIPAGRAVSYGGLAALTGVGSPRQAGRAMAESPAGTPWWRVVRADGSLPEDLAVVARGRWAAEGTPTHGRGARERIRPTAARWEPDEAAERVLCELAARARQPVTAAVERERALPCPGPLTESGT